MKCPLPPHLKRSMYTMTPAQNRALTPRRGDRVLILAARHYACFKDWALPVYGRITRIDGAYHYVRPTRGDRRRVLECYETEIVLVRLGINECILKRESTRPKNQRWH